VDVIALDDVLFVDVGCSRFIAAQAYAAAAGSRDLIVGDAVLHGRVAQLNPISRQPDKPAVFDRAIAHAFHVNGGVSGGEVTGVHGFVGSVPLMAIGAVEGEPAQDDVVDDMYDRLFHEMLDMMVRDSSTTTRAARLLFVAKHLERIGDYVTDICELTVYMREAEFIRHSN